MKSVDQKSRRIQRINFLAVVFFLAGSTQGNATQILGSVQGARLELIRVTSEAFPDETYSMGLEYDSSGSAVALYYSDLTPGSKVSDRRYSFAALSSPQLLIRAMDKYDLVKIRMNGMNLGVLYRQDVRYDQWREKKFQLDCDSKMRGCHVVDSLSHRPVTQAFVVSHYVRFFGFIKKAVGIEELQVR